MPDTEPTPPTETTSQPAADPVFGGPCTCREAYSMEPHGNGFALYFGRCNHRHGLNLANITEPDTKRMAELIEKLNNTLDSGEPAPRKLFAVKLVRGVLGDRATVMVEHYAASHISDVFDELEVDLMDENTEVISVNCIAHTFKIIPHA